MTRRRNESADRARERLGSMIELAQHYRGWTQREAAGALGRNVHAIVPDSGNPKLDMVVALSEILDWPVEMVVADLRGKMDALGDVVPSHAVALSEIEARALIRRAWELASQEQWEALINLSEPEKHGALDGELFAHLMYFRQQALESDGRYLDATVACRVGLGRVMCRSEPAYRLRAALSHHLFMAGSTHEAGAVALELVGELEGSPETSVLRTLLGYAKYIRGMVLRLHSARPGEISLEMAAEASDSLNAAAQILDEFGARSGSPKDSYIARTARVAAIEVDVLRGSRALDELLATVLGFVDGAVDVKSLDSWDAESLGWCCVFALRALTDRAGHVGNDEQTLAILTNKLDEVAERLGHWALRQHLFRVEHIHRVHCARDQGVAPAWNFDESDIRTLMGAMGRFPEFRPVGWQILKAVQAERAEGKDTVQ